MDFKIFGNFVCCTPRATNLDGSLILCCSSNGGDLSAWMLLSGWAVALPSAPVEYQTLEKAAQAKALVSGGFLLTLSFAVTVDKGCPAAHGH
ncbi:hypothetical protein KTQ42_22850 [Noviherbaspirillum sp. L7-7A]|uniref:hypothetical protein n=1 Tax=Noviherbaspirillum sp. L7-7A TaxID=2850560 RepID=UPI001C2BE89E|nr:hypothetical protein [Noviherbaspirillum sp. L7-7A]MBV0882119.1 hypothetical protein [Noviherbaspirillum sp. L7-7A]